MCVCGGGGGGVCLFGGGGPGGMSSRAPGCGLEGQAVSGGLEEAVL